MNLSYKKKKQFLITFTLCFGLMTAFFAGKNQMQANATAQGINARYRTAQEIRSYVASNDFVTAFFCPELAKSVCIWFDRIAVDYN